MPQRIAILVLIVALAGCAKASELGNVWTLQKASIEPPGNWISVALLYGYDDDQSACQAVAAALKKSDTNEKYSPSYRCIPGDARE